MSRNTEAVQWDANPSSAVAIRNPRWYLQGSTEMVYLAHEGRSVKEVICSLSKLRSPVKHDGDGVTAWACMAASRTGQLIFIDDKTQNGTAVRWMQMCTETFYLQLYRETHHQTLTQLDMHFTCWWESLGKKFQDFRSNKLWKNLLIQGEENHSVYVSRFHFSQACSIINIQQNSVKLAFFPINFNNQRALAGCTAYFAGLYWNLCSTIISFFLVLSMSWFPVAYFSF